MNTLLSIPGLSLSAGSTTAPLEKDGAQAAATGEAPRLKRAEASSQGPDHPAAPAWGVQATFSPQSLEALEAAALSAASHARVSVQDLGHAVSGAVLSATQALDEAGAAAAGFIATGAQALEHGVQAGREGVKTLASTLDGVVADTTQRLSSVAETTLGYGAAAVWAGGALLNELA